MPAATEELDLESLPDLETADAWSEWLEKALEAIPEVAPNEESVWGAWANYNEIDARFFEWAGKHGPGETQEPGSRLFHLRSAYFSAIAASGFRPETSRGLAVMLSVYTLSYRNNKTYVEEYQQCLEAASSVAFKLAHNDAGSQSTLPVAPFPETINILPLEQNGQPQNLEPGYHLNLDGYETIETADQWCTWLSAATDWVKEVTEIMHSGPLPEQKVYAMWDGYERLQVIISEWMQSRPSEETKPVGNSFSHLETAIYEAIAPFNVDTWLGLTIKLWMANRASSLDEAIQVESLQQVLQQFLSDALTLLGTSSQSPETDGETNIMVPFVGTRH